MSVKRYSVWEDEMFEEKHAINSTNGMVHLMVKHEDYAALEQKLAESQREFRAADATIENLQMQVEKLAAENAGLKAKGREALKEAAYVYSRYNRMVDHLDGESVDGQTLHEFQEAIEKGTPATDAFLAEVRAQGVEMFANELGNVHMQLRSGSNHAHAIKSAVFRAVEFAAQLRKGVQS